MKWLIAVVVGMAAVAFSAGVEPLIIDHRHTDVTQLTAEEIEVAKSVLHIAYGHTSHGSQVTSGMSGLVGFANGGGLGLDLPEDIFAWNNGGTDGALDLHDYAMGGDVGYYPQWVNNTVAYLDDPANSDVNVIMWSWCGQMDDKFGSGTLTNDYLVPMAQLEAAYSNVVFVYMTGHTEIYDDADNKAACAAIKQWCIDNNKVLFDFNDIEHYDPDGTYYEFVGDDLNYYATAGGSALGNWGTEWQAAHTEGVDWFNSSAAHSQPVLSNVKAYAIWALWCELAKDLDRDGFGDEWEEQNGGSEVFDDPEADSDSDGNTDWEEFVADTCPTNCADYFCITSISNGMVCFNSSSNRQYTLLCKTNLFDDGWVTNQMRMGCGGSDSMQSPDEAPQGYYRLEVSVP